MFKQRQKLAAVVFLLIVGVFLLHRTYPTEHTDYLSSKLRLQRKSKLVFPASFPYDVNLQEFQKNEPAFRRDGFAYYKATRYNRNAAKPKTEDFFKQFHTSSRANPLHIFHSAQQIRMNLKKCPEIEYNGTLIAVSRKEAMNPPLQKVVGRIMSEVDRGVDEYLQELKIYFDMQARLQLEFEVASKFWFMLAGSSVYLQEYGVHLMISRLIYCPDGSRNNPKLSLLYAQIFDEKWKEVEDISLVIPTNLKRGWKFFEHQDQGYTIMNFPALLPTPFWHDKDNPKHKYVGPEDARLVLVRNEAGYDEPLLIFNAEHQKQRYLDDDEDDYVLKQMGSYRSIFLSWPWQFQRGKENTDDEPDLEYNMMYYNRVKEMQIKNIPRQEKQKNWTPILSKSLRGEDNFDRYLYFIYRWSHLQILKCDITSDHGKCGFAYSLRPSLLVSSKVGPLRGGTPMWSINDLVKSSNTIPVEQIIPEGREIWVGFARAHLVRCGCGNDLYRPNLVVVTKDSIPDKDGNMEDHYKLSHVSSFMSLGVEVLPWDEKAPYKLCAGTNALIPNGISSWDLTNLENVEGKWASKDFMTLSISVSDSTVDQVHISGLFQALTDSQENSLFLPPGHEEKAVDSVTKDRLRIPESKDVDLAAFGYNNDNLVCSMEASVFFCSRYGRDKIKIEREKESEGEAEVDNYLADERMELYKDALYYVGLDQ